MSYTKTIWIRDVSFSKNVGGEVRSDTYHKRSHHVEAHYEGDLEF